MSDGDGQKALAPAEVLKASVQEVGEVNAPILLRIAGIAEEITAWWSYQRDIELRAFWRTEPILASAIYTVMSRQAAFTWTLDGPPRAVKRAHDILSYSDLGQGWVSLIEKGTEEICTQDNGWFLEIIRPKGAGPEQAPIGIAHLDSSACRRTGDPEIPVVYTDRKGVKHALKWYQVIMLAEMPSPIQTMNGVGFCAVSRVLKAAQILRDIATYKAEKVSSKVNRAIYLIQGIRTSVIRDGLKEAEEEETNKAFARFVMPKIIGSLDPSVPVNVHTLDMASLPDGFDEETTLRWYIAQLAMGFGTDYQEFAPMPGQKLGTGAQAEVMAQKARGKGSALFRKRLEFAINQYILPQSVDFKFVVVDPEEEADKARVARERAEERKIRIDSGEINVAEARQLALDAGDLPPEMMERDITEETQARDVEGAPEERERPREGETEAPKEGGEEASAKAKKALHPADEITDGFADALATWLGKWGRRISQLLWKEYQSRPKGIRRWLGHKQASILDDAEFWEEMAEDGYGLTLKFINEAAYAGLAAGEETLLKIGIVVDFDLVNPFVVEMILEHAFDAVKIAGARSFVESTRLQLRRLMASLYGKPPISGEGFLAALEHLFGKTRAEMIAVTEITSAYADAGMLAASIMGKELGLRMGYEVLTAADDLVCTICVEAAAASTKKPYPIDDEEHKPALHPRCRCDWSPVVLGEL